MIFDPVSSDLHLIWKTYTEFEGCTREPDGDLNHFIEEWKTKMAKVQSAGCQYSDLLMGLKLIEKVNLSHDSIASIISKLSSSTSVSESFLTQVVTNIKELSEINGLSENQSLELANIIETDVDDQEILEELDVESNLISCSECPVNLSDIESLTEHHLRYHPEMTNDKVTNSMTGNKSDSDFLKSSICDENLMVYGIWKELDVNSKLIACARCPVKVLDVKSLSKHQLEFHPDITSEKHSSKIGTKSDSGFLQSSICDENLMVCKEGSENQTQEDKSVGDSSVEQVGNDSSEIGPEIKEIRRIFQYYKCSYCDNKYKGESGLKFHLLCHHSKAQIKPKNDRASDIQVNRLDRALPKPIAQAITVPNRLHVRETVEMDFSERGSDSHTQEDISAGESSSEENLADSSQTSKNYKCSYCDNKYKGESGLKFHLLCHHSKEQSKQKNDRASDIQVNRLDRALPKPITQAVTVPNRLHVRETVEMDFCERGSESHTQEDIFARESSSEENLADSSQTSKNYKCSYCDKIFLCVSSLNFHLSFGHWDKAPVTHFKIDPPEKGTGSRNFDFHVKPMLQEKNPDSVGKIKKGKQTRPKATPTKRRLKKYFPCETCGKSFTKYVLERHIETAHSGRIYKCDTCTKEFTNLSVFERHMGVHKRQCSICQKIFTSSTGLKNHVETHNATKDYVCSYCGKMFKTSGVFREHLNIHTKEKIHSCNFCGKTFHHYSARRIHIRTFHTGEEKLYKCDFCNKRFLYPSKKSFHMRTHTGEKPFPCHVCGKGFVDSATAKRHVKNVHKIANPCGK